MDEIFQKSNQLTNWIRHNEESIFLLEDGFEDLKELLAPIEDEIENDQMEGKLINFFIL
jgi:sulfur relay (sulfurtransferase) complex TusBCD TusD component (DsrE family)